MLSPPQLLPLKVKYVYLKHKRNWHTVQHALEP